MKNNRLSKEEYITLKKQQLAEWNAEVTILKEKARKNVQSMNARNDLQLEKIKSKHKEGLQQLKDVKNCSETTWDKFKTDTETVFVAFRDSIDQFKSHF